MKGLDALFQMVQLFPDGVGQVVPDLFLEVLANGGDFLNPEIAVQLKASLEVRLRRQSFDVDAVFGWDDPDGGLHGDAVVSVDAFQNPVEHAGVLSVAGPQELALLRKDKN